MLEPIHCGRLPAAPLLPKLRGYFAEFLDNASSVGLRILSSSTCVGLRYGYGVNYSGFSRRMVRGLPYFISVPVAYSHCKTAFPALLVPRFGRTLHFRLPLPLRVPTVLSHRSAGISTCCPSATASALTLGPDLPRADQLYPGNLGYSAIWIPTIFSLLIPAFSLPYSPRLLTVPLHPICNAPLPMLKSIPELR